ncbi:MAG: response regulator transcription factor [Sphingomonadaceae bacterium]|nr:response regulator transcription factor [Sphingomonadaceae bacterium]
MAERLKILIVDDDAHIRRLLSVTLKRGGYEPVEASDARAALSLAAIVKPALALVDLGLPDRDGLEVVAALAAGPGIAVLVVSAREATGEKIAALDLGAEDYVTKPFDTDELLARIRAALRRRVAGAGERTLIRAGAIEIDLAARIVRRDGAELGLTPKEYALLAELARNAGRVVTHAQLLTTIWGPAHAGDIEYLRMTARGLRLKLEDEPSRPRLIRNEPGVGYRLIV